MLLLFCYYVSEKDAGVNPFLLPYNFSLLRFDTKGKYLFGYLKFEPSKYALNSIHFCRFQYFKCIYLKNTSLRAIFAA